jgi:hypothetical protein
LLARASAPSLLTWSGRADLGQIDNMVGILLSQSPSLQESASTLYSASVLDKESCLFARFPGNCPVTKSVGVGWGGTTVLTSLGPVCIGVACTSQRTTQV